MDHILYQMFKTILCILKKNNESVDNPSIRICVCKIENRITIKVKRRYYFELLTPETMKLLGGTENKTTKDKNVGNALHFPITEVVLVHF